MTAWEPDLLDGYHQHTVELGADPLGEGDLHQRKADGAILKVTGRGSKARAFDPLTGEELGPVPARSTTAIKVNNALRRAVRSGIATLTLMHRDPARRLAAANAAFQSADPDQLEALTMGQRIGVMRGAA